jgi:hypothetical protein
MENQELSKLLQQLHQEINTTQAVDEKGTELLRDLDKDIHTLLERSGETPVELNPINMQRLDDVIRHFETTHPSLTVLISKLLDTLNNSGI